MDSLLHQRTYPLHFRDVAQFCRAGGYLSLFSGILLVRLECK